MSDLIRPVRLMNKKRGSDLLPPPAETFYLLVEPEVGGETNRLIFDPTEPAPNFLLWRADPN